MSIRFHIVLRSALVAVSALVPMLAATQAPAAADATTITLSGTVTAANKGTYQEHPFDVPAGVTRIDVDFPYDNRGKGTELLVGERMFVASALRSITLARSRSRKPPTVRSANRPSSVGRWTRGPRSKVATSTGACA